MEKYLTRIIAGIFHPILMPTMLLAVVFTIPTFLNGAIPNALKLLLLALFFVNTTLLPLFFTFWLYKINKVSDLEVSDNKERRLPFLITAVLYCVTYYMIRRISLPGFIYLSVVGGCAAMIVVLIVNYFWKISAHMVGVGALTGALIGLSFRFGLDISIYIIISVLISGLVGYARLYANAHTQAQIYAGYALGFIFQFGFLYLLG